MIDYNNHTLHSKEISELKKQGHNLDDSGNTLHIIRFLWNNQLNKAYVPHPFRVIPELNEKLERDAIDMPYIVGPDPDIHLEGADEGLPNTPESLLKIQADYSIGDIKAVLKSDSGNRYGIIAIYPDYEEDVLNNKIPMLVSPTFEMKRLKGKDLIDANFLNLNAVNSGGYPVALTSIVGACKNGIKQCMAELSVFAAAGSLKASRKDVESFSSNIIEKIKPMSQESEVTLPALAKTVEDHGKVITEMGGKLDEIATSVAKLSTDKQGGVGVVDPNAPPAQASGNQSLAKLDISKHPDFIKLSESLKEVKTLSDKREKQIATELASIREQKATSIVDILFKGKKLTDEEKATHIKNWVEKKDADDNLENLDLIESTLKVAVPQAAETKSDIAAAGGPYGINIPELTGDIIDPENIPKNSSIMAKTIGGHN